MSSALKAALEDLLRNRRLQEDAPPLRGVDRPLSALPTGVAEVDRLIGGGLPRGQVSELFGPTSSGRTALALGTLARCTARGALVAWVDPGDRLDPASAADAGVDLTRLLWLRGAAGGVQPRVLMQAVSATSTVVGSGLCELSVLDLGGVPAAHLRRLPGPTWLRLQRLLEDAPGAVLLLVDGHTAHGPRGVSLSLAASGPGWSGTPGPGRLLAGLRVEARPAHAGLLRAPSTLTLRALA